MSEEPNVEAVISRLQRQHRDLRDAASLTTATRKVNEITSGVAGLPGEIEKLRERGYAFAGYLGTRAESLRAQWDDLRTSVERQIRSELPSLQELVNAVDPLINKLGMAGGKPAAVQQLAEQLAPRLETLEADIQNVAERVAALYADIDRDMNEVKQKISKFNWYMDMADEATFDFGATEAVYIVAKGEWARTGKGKEDPDGIFYITDQRLIFERKEKEGGFLGFGGKKIQGIEWEVPLSSITSVKPEKKGMLGGKDMVHLEFSSGGPGSPTTIEVKGGINANWYAQQIERASSGAIDQERALEVDPEVAEMVRNAPSACENCGAPFTMPITRGMTQIACEYCGSVTRL